MRTRKYIYLAMLITAFLSAASCGKNFTSSGSSLVTVSIGEDLRATLHTQENTIFAHLPYTLTNYLSDQAFAAIPTEVVSVRLTINGPGMDTMQATLNVAGQSNVTILIEVPNGPDRRFLLECFDLNGAVIYRGETVADLDGRSVTLSIAMVAVTYDTDPPSVIFTSPDNGATGIPIDTTVVVTFSEPMDDTTITASAFLLHDANGSTVPGTVSYNDQLNSAEFIPDSSLAYNEQYTATITMDVTDAAGNAMTADHAWVFTTEAAPDITPPNVTGTSPLDNASNVSVGSAITATFSESMDPSTITTSTFTINGRTGAVSYNQSTNTATFTPSTSFNYDTLYTATITTSAADLSGNPLTQDHAWTFRTAADADAPTFGGLESVTAPTFTTMQLSWSPAGDNSTAPLNIVYLIYVSTVPGGQNFAVPSFTTASGATTYTVSNLTPGMVYYYVVRARDEVGNVDTNTVEISGVAQGLYVDATNGTDSPTCGTQVAPCQSISQALANTPGNEGIFVAAGTYQAPVEFAVPLQLKPGTALFCLGTGYSTIIDSDQSNADAFWGNTGAVIDGCMILPGCDQTGIVDKVGGPAGAPAPMTINNVIINEASAGCGPLDNIILSADSTVTNSQIRNSTWHGIYVESGNPVISGNTIVGHSEGINISGGTPDINGNTFATDSTAIIVQTASAQITNNTFNTNIGTGIDVSTGTATIQGNMFTNNTDAIGIRVTAGSPTIDGNTIQNNSGGTGIDISTGSALIQNNSIQNNTGGVGIAVNGGTPTIGSGNTIEFIDTGISISAGSPVIDGNLIRNNTSTGIAVSYGASPGNPIINNNSIYCNAIRDMFVFGTSGSIDATSNTWDHAPPTTEPMTCGTPGVDICYDIFLPDFSLYNTAPSDACLP